MNFGQDQINWAKIDEIGQQVQSTIKVNAKDNTLAKTIFAKFPVGTHRLRQIPIGNPLENIPFMELGQHTARVPIQNKQTGATYMGTYYEMCWRFIYENFLAKTTQEERRDNTLLGHLTKQGKINEEETTKFQEYGCPYCKFHEHLVRYGCPKEDSNKLFTKFQYIWNIMWKFDPLNASGDNKLYVWGQSKQHFNSIIGTIRRDKASGIYTLDPEKGYDVFWTARNEGQARRYDSPSYDRIASPLLLGDQVPYNLADIMMGGFRPYDHMVNTMKKGYGNLITQYGYAIPGDLAIAAQLANPNPSPVPQQVFPQQAIPVPQNIPVNQVVVPYPPTTPPVREDVGGGYYKQGGYLYDPSGKQLF